MKPFEQIRDYFKENPGRTETECATATSISRNTVKQCVWKDGQRGLAVKDKATGGVTYEDTFADIPEKINSNPLTKATYDMLNRLLDQSDFITDDALLLKYSKEVRLYIAELKGLLR